MANGKNRVDIQVGFSVDKSGLSEMQSLFQQIANKAADPANKMKTGLQEAAKTASTLDNILSKTFNTDLGSLNVTKFNQELSKSGLTLKDVKANLSQAGNQGVTAFNRLSQAILGTNQQIRQSNKALDQLFTTFKNTIRYGISSSIFNNMANSIQRAFDYSKQLDTSLNDIRIVTDKSAESMVKFAQQANEASKGMGASTLDYTNAALIYYQQGLSDSEVQARAETTIKAANVTGQRGEEVSEQLTAVWNGYKVSAEETELYVDKLAAVAATTAADLEELSVGMSKVASAANAMGVDFDDLNAQIATIVSVTRQAPESVGTALKTIYARMGDLSVEGGVDEFGVSLGKVSEQMQMMGIQILDQNGNLRDMTTIMTEVAKKWDTWTEAQRQAAAVAMAGKRQYNNLIALFDNWDMYSNALETSQEAMGTLQEQQDIYMESTAAKLKTLKAAWQGLYDDAIDEDEINTGIEALTNLVEVFDNFISSFGGGLKSVAGFGAILSSVFNRQIAESIVAANQRLEVFKNNLALAQANAQMRALGTGGELDSKASATDIAVEANSKIQLEYAEKIYQARIGLNQEQANTLTGLQQEIGALEQEITLLEQQTKNTELTVVGHQKVADILKYSEDELFDLNVLYGEEETKQERIVNSIKKQSNAIQNVIEEEITRQGLYDGIGEVNSKITGELHSQIQLILDELATTTDIESIKEKISNLLDKEVAKEKNNLNTIKKEEEILNNVSNLRDKINSKREQQNNKIQQADSMLEAANSATTLTQNIMTVTSALGNMAMAWSSVNSLMDTWRNDSIDFGDKILQTMMTLGMTIPMIYNNYKKLTETFSTMNSITAIATANEAAHTAAIEANTVAGTANLIIKQNQELVSQKKIESILAEITAEETEDIITKKATASEILYGVAKRTNQGINDNYIQTIEAIILKKHAEEQATKAAAAAQAAAKTASLVFMGVMAALAVTIALVTNHFKKLREEASKNAEESVKNAKALTEEFKSNEQLISQYNELYQQYKNGEIKKEDLWDVTNKLIDSYDLESARLAALRGDYDSFTDSLNKARIAKEASMKGANQTAFVNAGINVSEQSRGQGFLGINNISLKGNDTLQIGTGNFFTDASLNAPGQTENTEKIKDLYTEIFETEEKVINLDRNNPLQILEFYEKAIQFQTRLNEEGLVASESYERISQIITDLNADGGIDKLIEVQQLGISGLLNSSGLNTAESQEDFNNKKEQLAEDLKLYIPNEEEIGDQISSYIATINTKFADQSLIDDFVKEKWGEDFNKGLYEIIKKYDPAIQSELLDKYHFNLTMGDTEKGIQELQKYVNYITNSPNGVYSIPFEMQMSTNETILKGKDINKSDWEALTASTPNAEETLGTREEFNNKSIGERITLMEQLNQKIQEEASAHIEAYEAWKSGQEEISNGLQEQIDLITKQIELKQHDLVGKRDTESIKQTKEEIKELEDQLENLSNQKYQIDLELNSDYFGDNIDSLLGGMIGEVVTQADQLKVAAESVGEAWTIAADDVQNFASIFPDLMADVNNFDWLENGAIQLTEVGRKLLNDTLENNEKMIASNKDVVLEAIDDRLIQLKADKELQTARIQALETYLSSELDSEANQEKLKQSLEQATAQYEETLRANNLVQEGIAATESNNISNQSNSAKVDGLKSLNDNINAVRKSYANIFNDKYGDVTLPGYKGSGISISSSYNEASVEEAKNTLDEQTKAFVEEAQKQLEEAKTQLSQDMLEIASLEGAAAKIRQKSSDAKAASDRVQSGHAGKESKSKSGGGSKDKQKKDKELKQLDDELDKYWEINKALDAIDRTLKKIDREQEHLNGPELIASLEEENKVLEQQKERYEQLYQAQQAEAAELRGQLSGMGVAFDESSGAILNYAEAVAAALATYNAAVAAFNAGPQDEAAQKSLEAAERAYENFKKLLDRYDTLVYTEMKDTEEKIEDTWRKEMENKLKAWKVKVELELDKNKLEQQWDDFITEAKKDFRKVFDTEGTKKDSQYQIRTMDRAQEDVTNIIKRQHEVEADMLRMKAGGESEIGFQSIAEARDALKELNDKMIESGNAAKEAYEQGWQNYLDGISQVADEMSLLNTEFERQQDELQFQREIIELLYGPKAYGQMDHYYEKQHEANINQIEVLQKQKETWRDILIQQGVIDKNTGLITKDYKDLDQAQLDMYNNMIAAEKEENSLTLDNLKLAKERYKLQVEAAFAPQEEALKKEQEEWEKIKKHSKDYYDSVESVYQIEKLSSKYNQSIAQAGSIAAQEKLNKLKEEELQKLRDIKKETGEVSKYDVQAADLRYQLALREIALDEARNNKTDMKVTRDEQGNWSYQYVADESEIEQKQQDLLDAWNDLYQLASDALEANLEALLELKEEHLEASKEIWLDDSLNYEEKIKKQEELDAEYEKENSRLAKENHDYRRDLQTTTAGLLKASYDADKNAVKSMTKSEQQLVKKLSENNINSYNEMEKAIENNYDGIGDKTEEVMEQSREDWTSAAQSIADDWYNGGDSVKAEMEDTYKKIKEADQTYRQSVDETAKAAKRDFSEQGITGAIDKATQATQDLLDKNEELCDDGSEYINELKEYVDRLREAWEEVCRQIEEAIDLLREYLQLVGEVEAAEATSAGSTVGPAPSTEAPSAPTVNGNGESSFESGRGSTASSRYQSAFTDAFTLGHTNTVNTGETNVDYYVIKNKSDGKIVKTFTTNDKNDDPIKEALRLTNTEIYDRKSLATGGYTGEWGDSSGRIAMLHQKELVLNADDTSNFLSGINTIRDMVASNGSIESAVLRAAANMAYSLGNVTPGTVYSGATNTNNENNNVFNITAEFPNANSVDEIREAILSLPNIASQYIHSNLR